MSCYLLVRYILYMHQRPHNSTALSDVICLFFVIVYLCVPVAGYDAIWDWYLSMLERFIYLHIVKSTPCNKSCKGLGFLIFILTFKSHFTFLSVLVLKRYFYC